MMLVLGYLLACSDPVQEYSIPKEPVDNWKDWSKEPQQSGPPVGKALGAAPQNGEAPEGINQGPDGTQEPVLPPNEEGAVPPDGSPPPEGSPPPNGVEGGENPSAPVEAQVPLGTGLCRPVASSEGQYPNGSGINVTGSIFKSVDVVGTLLIEFVKPSEEGAQTYYGAVCGFANEFSVEIPNNLGEVYVSVFIDVNGNGPTEEDPRGIQGPITFTQETELEEISVSNGLDMSPVSLPFIPFINMVNEPVERLPLEDLPDVDPLKPPETDVGAVREAPDVAPALEGDTE